MAKPIKKMMASKSAAKRLAVMAGQKKAPMMKMSMPMAKMEAKQKSNKPKGSKYAC